MIDFFAILLTHGLIAVACWRMLAREDLDIEPAETLAESEPADAAPAKPWLANQKYLDDDKSKSRDA